MSNFTPVHLPQSGPNDVVATLAEWSKQPGRQVRKGEILGSAETTKSVFDLEAPAGGTFWPLVPAGAEVPVGAIIAAVGSEHSTRDEAQAWLAAQTSAHAPEKAYGKTYEQASRQTPGQVPEQHPGQASGQTPVQGSGQGSGQAPVRPPGQHPAQAGAPDVTLASSNTGAGNTPADAPADAPADTATGAAAGATPIPQSSPAPSPMPGEHKGATVSASVAGEEGRAVVSPPRPSTLKAELLAQRHGIDLAQVPATGEKITEADVQAYLAAHSEDAASPATWGTTQRGATAPAPQAATPHAPVAPHDLVDGRFPANRPQRILIIGGGNGAVQILDVLARTPHQRAVAILDDDAALHGKQVAGVPILGGIDLNRAADMAAAGQFDAAVISISTSIPARTRIFAQWKSRGIAFANVIHPSCVVGTNVHWGEGNVLMALCHVGPCTSIGDNNFLSAYCSIEHHNQLGSHCSFGPAVVTSSRVQIGDGVRFGTGIHIEPGIRIGAGSVIASGLAITQHIPPQSLLKAHVGYSIRPR
jgi:sugar O-acyltransferase (sialic acid O-acetyltransferase NeuD family)